MSQNFTTCQQNLRERMELGHVVWNGVFWIFGRLASGGRECIFPVTDTAAALSMDSWIPFTDHQITW